MAQEHDTSHPDLDPENWDDFAKAGHQALDAMIGYLRGVRDRKVWQEAPADVAGKFASPLPWVSRDIADVLADVESDIKPFVTGNTHPLFMGWVHGAGTPVGMLAEMLAAGLDANCGGRNHIGITVEQQITRWVAELFGFPKESSGLFVTGTSMANFLGLLVARTASVGDGVKEHGLRPLPQLTAYTSAEVHGCVVQSAEMSGIGSDFMRRIPVDAAGAMRLDCLENAIATDRQRGLRPFLVVGTAGTVNTGAFDDLNQLSALCRRERLWFHVDGAFGAMCALSPKLRPLVAGLEHADSVAFDFHKWAHVPYDAGFLIVRDPDVHRRTFSNPAVYLNRAEGGLAAGDVWPCDLGPDLSRGFRALKAWMTFQTFGAARIGACIEHNCRTAKYLESRINESGFFEARAPVALNIVCFGLKIPGNDALNGRIAIDLHRRGVAAPSTTKVDGQTVIRAAIVNHRTTESDMDRFLEELHISALNVLRAEMGGPQEPPAERDGSKASARRA
jgi:aromatic-L-amino-acid decarboxylase